MSLMRKVLVTGAGGFIASKVCAQLLDKGVEVVGVDNLNNYYDIRLKQFRIKQLVNRSGFYFHELDIEDRDGIKGLFEKHTFDVVFNLAARAGVRASMVNPFLYMATNAIGSLNLLEQLKEHKAKFILASTSSLYAGQKVPFTEDLPVNTPLSPYAASKKSAELMAYSYHHLYGIDVSIVRYFTVYGPAGRPDMSIFRFIQQIDTGEPLQIFGDGGQSRDFTYVDDIAKGTILAAKEVGFEIFNLGGGKKPISIRSVVSNIEENLQRKAIIETKEFHKADITETWADIEKAKRILGWEPTTSFETGLKRTIAWYLENRDFARSISLSENI